MNKQSSKVLLANICGTFGYITCLTLWGWTGILYVPTLLENDQVSQFIAPPPSEVVTTPATPTDASSLSMILAVAITAVVLIATVIIALKAPKTITTTGKTVTTKAANSALPLVTKGKKVSPVKRQRLTLGLVKLAKLFLAIIPIAVACIGAFIELSLPFELAILVSSVLAMCALFWFSMQYVAAHLLGINTKLLV